MPMAAIVARLRAAYAAELAKYARHHRSRANLWLHAVLAPVEWAACLVALRCAAGGAAVHAAQLAVVAGAACARPAVALPQLVLSPLACAGAANASSPLAAAAALWVGAVVLQVGLGHGVIEGTAPSAAAEPVAAATAFFAVTLAWDPALLRRR